MRRSRELAELLLRKAAHDEYVFIALWGNREAPQEVALFHAQQAVEKMIKAVLALSAVRFRKIHDLGALIDLARGNGIAFPKELEGVTRLTPFATYFRYEEGHRYSPRSFAGCGSKNACTTPELGLSRSSGNTAPGASERACRTLLTKTGNWLFLRDPYKTQESRQVPRWVPCRRCVRASTDC